MPTRGGRDLEEPGVPCSRKDSKSVFFEGGIQNFPPQHPNVSFFGWGFQFLCPTAVNYNVWWVIVIDHPSLKGDIPVSGSSSALETKGRPELMFDGSDVWIVNVPGSCLELIYKNIHVYRIICVCAYILYIRSFIYLFIIESILTINHHQPVSGSTPHRTCTTSTDTKRCKHQFWEDIVYTH